MRTNLTLPNKARKHLSRPFLDISSWLPALMVAIGSASVDAHSAGLETCVTAAAERFGHTVDLLMAIVTVESAGNCSAINSNTNGSRDIGCMQINTAWLPTLKTKFGISERDLLDPCTNVNVGAWILARNVREYGQSWRAVGAYNATSESKRINYAWKVRSQLASR